MKLGIIGTGRIALPRARKFLSMEDVSIDWICSRQTDRARAFLQEIGPEYAAKAGEARTVDDWKEAVSLYMMVTIGHRWIRGMDWQATTFRPFKKMRMGICGLGQ